MASWSCSTFSTATSARRPLVNNLRTCRLRQFEHVVASERPTLFDQFDLSSGARTTLLTYVKSLEDWASGVIK